MGIGAAATAVLRQVAETGCVTVVGGAMDAPFLAVQTAPELSAVPVFAGPNAAARWATRHPALLRLDGGLWAQAWVPRQAILLVDQAARSRFDLLLVGADDGRDVQVPAFGAGPELEGFGLRVDWSDTPVVAAATWRLEDDGTGTAVPVSDTFPSG